MLQGAALRRVMAGLLVTASVTGLAMPQGALAQEKTATEDATPAPANAPASGTEGADIVVTGTYLGAQVHGASKMDLSILETPFSNASYTPDFVKAVQATNVSDMYRYMAGVQRSGNTGYDINIRGITSNANDRNAILVDGLPGLAVRFGSPPTIGVDRIEVVKGPTAVLYGQGQPGGFIDIFSKRPSAKAGVDIDLQYNIGAGPYHRAHGGSGAFSATGPIGGSDTFLGIATVELIDRFSFRDYNFERGVYFAPGFTWNIGPRTELTLLGEYRYVTTKFEGQLVAPFRDVSKIAKINVSYQSPDDTLLERGTVGSAFLTHHFSDDVKFNIGYRYVDHYDDGQGFDNAAIRADGVTLGRRARDIENTRTYSFADANLNAKFDTFGIKHKLLLGFTGGRETNGSRRIQFFNGTATGANSLDVNIYNPIQNARSRVTYPAGTLQSRATVQKSLGFYATDLIEPVSWLKILVGVRRAHEKQEVTDLLAAPGVLPRRVTVNKTLPLAGAIVQPLTNLSFYTSYSTSYVPVSPTVQDINGQFTFVPTYATSIEGGVKGELFGHRLLFTASLFDIKRRDVVSSFNCLLGTCSRQVGGDRSTGVEIEASGSPIPHMQVIAGYSHTNSRITKSDIAVQVNATSTNSPKDAFKFWARYDAVGGPLDGVGAGLGATYVGRRVGLLPTGVLPVGVLPQNETIPVPSYFTMDAGLFYKLTQEIGLTLKVNNLFDRRYVESVGATGELQIAPGQPRTIQLAARMKF